MNQQHGPRRCIRPILTGVCFCLCLFRVVPLASANDGDRAAYDRLWSHTQLYRNPGEGMLQSLALSGRLQADAAWFDTDQGDLDERDWRRFRFGFTARFSNDWAAQLEGDFDLNASAGDSYQRLTDAYVSWEPSPALEAKFLKQSAGFTLDGATSSKNLLALERSNLTDNLWFTAEYFSGATLAGTLDQHWTYKAGVFSTDDDDGVGSFDASYFTLTRLAYNLAGDLGLKNAEITLDFVYQQEDADNNTPDFSNVVSLNSKWEDGRWGLWTDTAAGRGYADQRDVWGASLMPFYNASERLQLVLRYTYLRGDGKNALRLGRYNKDIVSGRGDRYNEMYAGLNLYFYSHKLKWQTGIQYTDMSDRANDGGASRGWGLTTGLRLYW